MAEPQVHAGQEHLLALLDHRRQDLSAREIRSAGLAVRICRPERDQVSTVSSQALSARERSG